MKESIPNKIENKEKPAVLYIGCQTRGRTEFVPRRGRHRDENEGPVIFSTPDKALASIFTIEGHSDSWTKIGYYGKILTVIICMSREDFIKRDHGGVIYEVPSDTFDFNPNLGMGEKEWTSRDPVKPNLEVSHNSTLDTMVENGVQVYFVDKKSFDEIWDADDYGKKILSGVMSENSRRGKNIKAIY